MNQATLPRLLSKAVLRGLASPDDKLAIRVIHHEVNNSGVFRLRCRGRQYLFERDHQAGRHVLDIPFSVYNHGVRQGRYREGDSIPADLRTAERTPFEFQIVPWQHAETTFGQEAPEADAPAVDFIAPLRSILSKLGAPEIVVHAFELIDGGDHAALLKLAESIVDASEDEGANNETAAEAEKTRKKKEHAARMREAKARKKAAREKAAREKDLEAANA